MIKSETTLKLKGYQTTQIYYLMIFYDMGTTIAYVLQCFHESNRTEVEWDKIKIFFAKSDSAHEVGRMIHQKRFALSVSEWFSTLYILCGAKNKNMS